AALGSEASKLTTASAAPLTRAGTVIGTMPYMSPEQLEGKSVDGRSDVFSLGVVLYEMATGRRPFSGETAASLIADIMNGRPRDVDIVRRDLPHHLARIIRHCLEKDPNHRFQTARDVSNELVDLRDENTGGATERESQSVAVLPFANLSPDPENEYFADGLTDELISALSRIPELRVPSRTSTSLFKGAGKSILTIAHELGVRYVVEGSVRRVENNVRITAQLIDGRSDAHLWAERYSGTLDDIFDLQESLSRRIVEALAVTLAPHEARPAGARPEPQAYDAYLRGRSYLEQVTANGRRRAIESFNLAIAADPSYARAHAALATAYLQELTLGGAPEPDIATRARVAAERALELDPATGAAHATLGWLALAQGWDWSGAEVATQRGAEAEPPDTAAMHVYSILLIALGRLEDAMAISRRMLELDPLSPLMNTHHAMQYYYARQYDRALEHADRTVAMDPTFVSVHGALGAIYVQMGRYDEAVAAYEDVMALSGTPRETIEAFRDCYEKEGVTGFWRWRAKTRPTRDKAVAHAALGESDEAFAWLRRALQENPLGLMNLNADPSFDPLRTDPRFNSLLERMRYPKTG
ncbi:MAG: tetratricopeptide repeat protein, partial [Gemmatimonadetes bacterium]|nr:tetratricopeptide repeat protein [Gemmatimonadota bacterium]